MYLVCCNCGSTDSIDHHCWAENVLWNVYVTEQGKLATEPCDEETNRAAARKLTPEQLESVGVQVLRREFFDCRNCEQEQVVVRKTDD